MESSEMGERERERQDRDDLNMDRWSALRKSGEGPKVDSWNFLSDSVVMHNDYHTELGNIEHVLASRSVYISHGDQETTKEYTDRAAEIEMKKMKPSQKKEGPDHEHPNRDARQKEEG